MFFSSLNWALGWSSLFGWFIVFFSGGDHVFLLLDFFFFFVFFFSSFFFLFGILSVHFKGVSDILFAVFVSDTFDLKIPVNRDPRQL